MNANYDFALAAVDLRKAWELYIKARAEFVRLNDFYREQYARYEEPGIIGGDPEAPTRSRQAYEARIRMLAARDNVHKYVARLFEDEVDGE